MESLLLSINKAHLNSAESSDDQNRSTVKRLFSSVFSIVAHPLPRSTMTRRSLISASKPTNRGYKNS
jgi:hypothetical protein